MVGKDNKTKKEVNMHTRINLAPPGKSTTIQMLLTAIGAVGIPAIILPFVFGYSPLGAAQSQDLFSGNMWRLSWPFFLPVLITTAIVRWVFLKKYSQTEIIAGYIVSAVILSVTFSGYVAGYDWRDDAQLQIALTAPLVILSLGIFVVLKIRKKLIPKPSGAIIVMQVAYLANCSLCLIAFSDNWQIAAYLSLATAIAYLAQIILLLRDNKPDKHVHTS